MCKVGADVTAFCIQEPARLLVRHAEGEEHLLEPRGLTVMTLLVGLLFHGHEVAQAPTGVVVVNNLLVQLLVDVVVQVRGRLVLLVPLLLDEGVRHVEDIHHGEFVEGTVLLMVVADVMVDRPRWIALAHVVHDPGQA
jgi:hypothetical protein